MLFGMSKTNTQQEKTQMSETRRRLSKMWPTTSLPQSYKNAVPRVRAAA